MALDNLHATEMRKANDEAGQNRQGGGCQGSCALVVFVGEKKVNYLTYSHHIAMVF
jgi:hypothetical protein